VRPNRPLHSPKGALADAERRGEIAEHLRAGLSLLEGQPADEIRPRVQEQDPDDAALLDLAGQHLLDRTDAPRLEVGLDPVENGPSREEHLAQLGVDRPLVVPAVAAAHGRHQLEGRGVAATEELLPDPLRDLGRRLVRLQPRHDDLAKRRDDAGRDHGDAEAAAELAERAVGGAGAAGPAPRRSG